MSKKRFDSAADRQRAYRERKRLEEPDLPVVQVDEDDDGPLGELVDDEQLLRDSFGYARSEERTKAERDAAAARMLGTTAPTIPSLEVYVAEGLAGARLYHEQTSPQATGSTKELEVRLARAEAYARWRYRGFLAGEIASL